MSVTFIGWDAEGDKVWQHTDGRVVYADDERDAVAVLDFFGGISMTEYIKKFGPITKEAPSWM